jgi:hypothetical protein
MATAVVGAGNAVAQQILAARIDAAFRRWDEALRAERKARMQETMRATAAEAQAKGLRAELVRAQMELRLLRSAAA